MNVNWKYVRKEIVTAVIIIAIFAFAGLVLALVPADPAVPATNKKATCGIHVAKKGVYYEQAVRVELWFRNHPQQAAHPVGKCVIAKWRYLVYKRLIPKWIGVHKCEGAWDSRKTYGLYDGGLQMDTTFQNSYGREFISWWGPAYSWPPAYQMVAAERAYHSGRGFGPWPVCGAYGNA